MSQIKAKQIVTLMLFSFFAYLATADTGQPVPDEQEAKQVHDAMQASAECVSAVAVSGVDVPALIIPVSGETQVAVMIDTNLTSQQKDALKNCAAAVNNRLAQEKGSGRMSESLANQIMSNAAAFVNGLHATIQKYANPSIDPMNAAPEGIVATLGVRG